MKTLLMTVFTVAAIFSQSDAFAQRGGLARRHFTKNAEDWTMQCNVIRDARDPVQFTPTVLIKGIEVTVHDAYSSNDYSTRYMEVVGGSDIKYTGPGYWVNRSGLYSYVNESQSANHTGNLNVNTATGDGMVYRKTNDGEVRQEKLTGCHLISGSMSYWITQQ